MEERVVEKTLARRVAHLFCILAFLSPCHAEDSNAAEYRIGAQDRLDVKVFDLRANAGDAHKWAAFDGETIVDAAGFVSLPLLGRVSVGGLTTQEVSEIISNRMQSRVGLTEKPSTVVQILKYRPFYVNGAVETPGEYDFRPGLTIIQALSISGGLVRAKDQDLATYQKEESIQSGELASLKAEEFALRCRFARLAAEIEGRAEIKFPEKSDDEAIVPSDKERKKIIDQELRLFNLHKDSANKQVVSYESSRALLLNEIVSLRSKETALNKQVELANADLIQVRELAAKGLAISTRQTSAEQMLTTFRVNLLDVSVAIDRAQQELGKLDRENFRDIAKEKQDRLTESSDTMKRMSEVLQKQHSSNTTIFYAQQQLLSANATLDKSSTVKFTILRKINEKTEELAAEKTDAVFPGDVIQVSIERKYAGQSDFGAGGKRQPSTQMTIPSKPSNQAANKITGRPD